MKLTSPYLGFTRTVRLSCFLPSRFSLTVAAFLIVSAISVRPTAADDEAQLEVIRDGYVQAFTSIRNVWCRYEERVDLSKRMREIDVPKARIWEWATEGEKYHYSSIPAETDAGTHYGPYWESTDGKDFWKLEYNEQDEIDRALKKKLTEGTWRMRGRVTPGQFLGLYFNVGKYNTRGLTLQSILETVPLTFGGQETIDGHECWQVDFAYPGESSEYEVPMTVFFDPAANYLPRRLIQYSTSGGDPLIRTVLKFSEVKDGDGRSIYFPTKMQNEHPLSLSRVQVLDVKVNEKLSPTLYRPRIPRNVILYDLDDQRSVQALQRKLSEARRQKRERLKSETAAKTSRSDKNSPATSLISSEPLVDARPSFASYGIIVLVIGGLVMLLIASYSYWFAKK